MEFVNGFVRLPLQRMSLIFPQVERNSPTPKTAIAILTTRAQVCIGSQLVKCRAKNLRFGFEFAKIAIRRDEDECSGFCIISSAYGTTVQ